MKKFIYIGVLIPAGQNENLKRSIPILLLDTKKKNTEISSERDSTHIVCLDYQN